VEEISKIPPDIPLERYFTEVIPQQFRLIRPKRPPRELVGTELSLQYDIEGPGGGTWSIIVRDGRDLSVFASAYEKAAMTAKVSEEYVRDSFSGVVPPMLELEKLYEKDFPSHLKVIGKLHGKLKVRMKLPNGKVHASEVIFNKSEIPSVTMEMSVEDVWKMRNKKLDGRTAFIQNRIKVEGDILLALRLSQFKF